MTGLDHQLDYSPVLILAPSRRDAQVTRELLERENLRCKVCADAASLAEEINIAVGAVLLTDAAFANPQIDWVIAALNEQPTWSDVPVVLMSRSTDAQLADVHQRMVKVRNKTILERPSSSRTLLSAIQTALRARRRQYQLRDQLCALAESEQTLKQRQRELQSLIESTPDVLARFDKNFRHVFVNAAAIRTVGLDAKQILGRTNRELGLAASLCDFWEAELKRVFSSCEPRTLEFNFPHAQGDRYFSNLLIPELGDSGEVETVLCVGHDVTVAKNALNELQAADRRKDEFLAMLAHELRNPLAPIRNTSELLARVLPAEMNLQNAVNILRRQSKHLTHLVDDLLDISRINHGRIELQRETLDLSQIVAHALETVEHLVSEKQHRLIFNPTAAISINGDRARMVQSIANVLTNAAKYTDPGGLIRVEVHRHAPWAQVAISDNGVGIAPELLPRIFDLFVQGDRSLDRSQGGLGIGLSVVKRLVEMHGGQVQVFSAGLGKGSRFEIQLPLADSDIAAPAAGDSPMTRSKRILIVDDNHDAADSLAFVLGLDGHETEAVYSSRMALERAAAWQPEVILLDIGLPEMNGYEVASHLRQSQHAVRLIALTGYGTANDVQRAFAAGFDGHVIKPVDFEALSSLIDGQRSEAEAHVHS